MNSVMVKTISIKLIFFFVKWSALIFG